MKTIEEFRQKVADAINQDLPYIIIDTGLAKDIYLQLKAYERLNGDENEKEQRK